MHYALWLCLAIAPLPNVFTINISILPLSVSIMILPLEERTETFKEEDRESRANEYRTTTERCLDDVYGT